MADEEAVAAEAAREEQTRVADRRRRWGCLVYLAVVLLLPTLILMAVGTVLVVADRRAAEEALDRTRQAGDPLTPEEMRAYYGATSQSEEATQRWREVIETLKSIDQHEAYETVPLIGRTKAAFDERGLYDAATLALVEPFLAESAAEALGRAHAARDLAPHVRFPFAFEEGWNARLDEIQWLRHLPNLLALEAEVHASRGDPTKATESLLTLIAVSETLAEAPDPIAYLVRAAVFGIATYHGMRLIDGAEFSPQDLKRLQEAYARQSFHRQMVRAVRGNQLQAYLHFEEGAPFEQREEDFARRYPLRGEDLAMTLELHRHFLDGAGESFAEADRAATASDARREALEESMLAEYRYAVTQDGAISFGGMVNAGIRLEVQARLCVACCACERYRQEHGEWPSSLATLEPDYLPEVPLDPVDDRPLRYEVDGERMIIHSIAHFREENQLVDSKLGDGIASQALGEPKPPRKY